MFRVKKDLGKLNALKTTAPQAADRIVEKVARRIEAGAKQRAPVDTGTLRNSITVEKTGEARRTIGATVDYATYVEFGTSSSAAQPFLMPAADAEAPALKRELRDLT